MLVLALTGTDPDRLAEEKAREMIAEKPMLRESD
jgi:hypothetical protein